MRTYFTCYVTCPMTEAFSSTESCILPTGGSFEKLTCRKVSKGAWSRKWKGNRFVVRSGNPSQISLFPAVWFCSSYLITFLVCKTCIIPAQVPVRLIRITYLKSAALKAALQECQFPPMNPSLPSPHSHPCPSAKAIPETAPDSTGPSC